MQTMTATSASSKVPGEMSGRTLIALNARGRVSDGCGPYLLLLALGASGDAASDLLGGVRDKRRLCYGRN